MTDQDLLSSYGFELPEALIAKTPTSSRSASRMLVVDPSAGRFFDAKIQDMPWYLKSGDRLFFNNTKVMKARIFAKKLSGGAIEILIERLIDKRTALVQMGVSKKPRVNQEIVLEDGTRVVVAERRGMFWVLKLMGSVLWPDVMDKIGHMPLPPYLQRDDDDSDVERYQTVYAQEAQSVAAPTAGLHFDHALLEKIDQTGARRFEVTLHVGAGTFAPIRVNRLSEHQMHFERFEVSPDALQGLNSTQSGRRIAIGTTSLRTLESLPADADPTRACSGETGIFITPGYQFRQVDGLLTNFHLPESSLMVLVCAFAGRELILQAYQHAIEQRYRFYSYGDCMLILPGALLPR